MTLFKGYADKALFIQQATEVGHRLWSECTRLELVTEKDAEAMRELILWHGEDGLFPAIDADDFIRLFGRGYLHVASRLNAAALRRLWLAGADIHLVLTDKPGSNRPAAPDPTGGRPPIDDRKALRAALRRMAVNVGRRLVRACDDAKTSVDCVDYLAPPWVGEGSLDPLSGALDRSPLIAGGFGSVMFTRLSLRGVDIDSALFGADDQVADQ